MFVHFYSKVHFDILEKITQVHYMTKLMKNYTFFTFAGSNQYPLHYVFLYVILFLYSVLHYNIASCT